MTKNEAITRAVEAFKHTMDSPIATDSATLDRRIAERMVNMLEALGLIKFDEVPIDPKAQGNCCEPWPHEDPPKGPVIVRLDPEARKAISRLGLYVHLTNPEMDRLAEALAAAGYQITKTAEPPRELTDEEATDILQTLWWTYGSKTLNESVKAMAAALALAGVQLVRKP